MNDTCKQLVARMVISTMAGNKKITWGLYEKLQKENRLHVSVKEILEYKERIA